MAKYLNFSLTLLLIFITFTTVYCQDKETIDFLISNASVISIENERIETNRDILIKGGKILAINNHKKNYTGYNIKEKIDAKGKYIIPSLIDMHVHIPKGLHNTVLPIYFANGITMLRSMRTVDAYSEIKEELPNRFDYPNIYFSAPTISRRLDFNSAELDSLFSKYKREGFNFVKILSVKDSIIFKNILASSDKHNIELAGHYLSNISKKLFYKANYKTVEHLGGLIHSDSIDLSSINEFVDRNLYICPTLNWYYISDKLIEEKQILNNEKYNGYIPDTILKIWKERYVSKKENKID